MAEITVTEELQKTLLEAVYELDKLARVVPGLVPLDEDQVHFTVRGICGRMLRLTSVLMSGLDQDDLDADRLRMIVDLSGSSQG